MSHSSDHHQSLRLSTGNRLFSLSYSSTLEDSPRISTLAPLAESPFTPPYNASASPDYSSNTTEETEDDDQSIPENTPDRMMFKRPRTQIRSSPFRSLSSEMVNRNNISQQRIASYNQQIINNNTQNRSISEMHLFGQSCENKTLNNGGVVECNIKVHSPYNEHKNENKENVPRRMGAIVNGRNPLSLSTDCIFRSEQETRFGLPILRFQQDKTRLQAEAENIRKITRLSPYKTKLQTLANTSQPELNCLCPTIVAQLIQGCFNQFYDKIFVIDCRFEYEFDGGHIKGAVNFPKEDDVDKFFIKCKDYHTFGEKICLVFHCEFSSHRGPKSYKRVRCSDRKINENNYPDLFYPEMYLLEGGYRQFFKEFPHLCEPQGYVEMKDPLYIPEMRLGLQNRGRSKSQRRFFTQAFSNLNMELCNDD
jgi:hypothetical protein